MWNNNNNNLIEPHAFQAAENPNVKCVADINHSKCINTYQLVLSYWVCLFWSGSPWHCQDSVSLVHCTAVTYSHSLTHIYSSSITGFWRSPRSLHSWSPKEWVKDKATCSRWPTAVGPVWSAVGDYVPHPTLLADTQPYMYQEKRWGLFVWWGGVGWGGWEGDIERKYTVTFFFLGVADGDVLKKKPKAAAFSWRWGFMSTSQHY